MPDQTPIAKWFNSKFVEWQNQEGERKTIIEFADYLGVNRSLLSYWMNGSRIPSEDNLIKIAFILGFEIYDILGIQRPNMLYLYMLRNWEKVPESIQRHLADTIAKYSKEPLTNEVKKKNISKVIPKTK